MNVPAVMRHFKLSSTKPPRRRGQKTHVPYAIRAPLSPAFPFLQNHLFLPCSSSTDHSPSVKFGIHTSASNTARTETAHSVGDSGPDNEPALHFTVEATDPRTFVHCARTCFFGSRGQSRPVESPGEEDFQEETPAGDERGSKDVK
jgi:hypothetical protein